MATINCSSKILNFNRRFAIFIALKEKFLRYRLQKILVLVEKPLNIKLKMTICTLLTPKKS